MYLLLWDNVIGEQIDMYCVHTVFGVKLKLWIGPKGELDKELFAYFRGCYYLSQAHSVRWDLWKKHARIMFDLVGFPLVLGLVLELIWRFLCKNCRENSFSWYTNESAYCTNLLHFKDIKHIKTVQKWYSTSSMIQWDTINVTRIILS